ncbi:hypothetical protein M2J84_05640 [Comamonas aquatica]|uniref:hypothetical protein n=1 Tax=Comamonas aquatica TaxID=225991 RepID=UPI0022DDFB88|nr:hypothetical protein [Comamonas aquatica]WBM43118.1 hypothetical protein M2J84_05640 [Comamonas aquatica]
MRLSKISAVAFLIASTAAFSQVKLSATAGESDYVVSTFFVDKLHCENGKSRLLENYPEIVSVKFSKIGSASFTSSSSEYGCSIDILHKKTFKIEGKSFHIFNENLSGATAAKFTVHK